MFCALRCLMFQSSNPFYPLMLIYQPLDPFSQKYSHITCTRPLYLTNEPSCKLNRSTSRGRQRPARTHTQVARSSLEGRERGGVAAARMSHGAAAVAAHAPLQVRTRTTAKKNILLSFFFFTIANEHAQHSSSLSHLFFESTWCVDEWLDSNGFFVYRTMTAICFVCNLPILSHQVGLVWQGGNGWDDLVREQVSGNAPVDTPTALEIICYKYAFYERPDFTIMNLWSLSYT